MRDLSMHPYAPWLIKCECGPDLECNCNCDDDINKRMREDPEKLEKAYHQLVIEYWKVKERR